MRGIGGPLLCIGDLLSDVGEENEEGVEKTSPTYHPSSSSSSKSSLSDLNNNNAPPPPLPDLTKLFQVFFFIFLFFFFFSPIYHPLVFNFVPYCRFRKTTINLTLRSMPPTILGLLSH
jgi:hypothetical protein